jgi:hypothetical protein
MVPVHLRAKKVMAMDAQDLYGLPLERFTEERNALARELRREGRREQAAEVSKLRKPSVAAWAVNQLVRTQRRQLAALFNAGDSLQKAQAQLLAGRSEAERLRAALEDERIVTEQLTERARGLLSSEGHELTPATLERVSETLHAAAFDGEARRQVQEGCLVRELKHVGLGGPVPSGASQVSASSARRRPAKAAASRRGRGQVGRAEDSRAAARSKTARAAELQAQRRAERAAGELKAAQERRDCAAHALGNAEAELAAARAEAEKAVRELSELQRSPEG